MLYFVEEVVKAFIEEQRKIKDLKMRICNICEIEKDIIEYNLRKDGKYKYKCCKLCYSIKRKDSSKRYYEENKERLNLLSKEYYIDNKDTLAEKHREYIEKNKDTRQEYLHNYNKENREVLAKKRKDYVEKNKDVLIEKKKIYYQNLSAEQKGNINERNRINYQKNIEENRIKKNNYIKEKMESDTLFKLTFNIRTLIRNSIKREFTEKSKKTIEILGCSFEEFKIHLESMFDQNMNWDNHGSYWHMDHKTPVSWAKNEEELYKLNHYTNFQPLYGLDNLSKGNKYEG